MLLQKSRRKKALFLAGIFSFLVSGHLAKAEWAFFSGNDIISKCKSRSVAECLGYLEGIAEVMMQNSVNGYVACFPIQVTTGQLEDAVIQYLHTHAATRHLAGVGLVAHAYADSFPCH